MLFAKRGYDVVGTDLVSEAIEAGRQLKEKEGLANLEFVVGDYESLAFQEEFDVVVFFDCRHHALDEVSALQSAWRALKPGGICVTPRTGPRSRAPFSRHHRRVWHDRARHASSQDHPRRQESGLPQVQCTSARLLPLHLPVPQPRQQLGGQAFAHPRYAYSCWNGYRAALEASSGDRGAE